MRPFSTVADSTRTAAGRHFLRRRGVIAGSLTAFGALAVVFMAPAETHAATATKTARAAQPTRSASESANAVYTIKKGDTLSSIASRQGVSVQAVATVNGINNKDNIVAGRQLLIPAKAGAVQSATTGSSAPKITAKTVKLPAGSQLPSHRPSPGQAPPTSLKERGDYQRLKPAFAKAAAAHNVPVELLQAMAWQESGWQNKVVSSTGAVGIGQLMPDTITFVNEALVTKPLSASDPAQNIQMSAAFLRYLLNETNGDTRLALASYYQGLGSVRRVGLFGETQQYIRSVLAVQARYF